MLEQGLMRQAGNGTFYILPLLQRSVQKAIDLVDHHMQHFAGAEKLTLPILTSADLWRKSGRLETAGGELMSTTDRHGKRQILGPVSDLDKRIIVRASSVTQVNPGIQHYCATQRLAPLAWANRTLRH